MNTPPDEGQQGGGRVPRNAGSWAQDRRINIDEVPEGATKLNLQGRQILGAMQGFGQLWQKTYRIRLQGADASPEAVMAAWKANFDKFQPDDNHFYVSDTGVQPGEVLFIDTNLPVAPGTPGVVPLATGVKVLYADETSFTVMTPEGFPEAGWNTFSAYDDDGCTVAQVQSMARAADPLYEFGYRVMGGAAKQEKTWAHVLRALGQHFGVEGRVEMIKELVDPALQWRYAKNVLHNAMFPSIFYRLGTPVRWLGRKLKRGKNRAG